jgi:hypothetical protein
VTSARAAPVALRDEYGDFRFARGNGRCTVHVVAPFRDGDLQVPLFDSLWKRRTACGRLIRLLFPDGGDVSEFHDEDLCRSCYRSVPEQDRAALFEHDQEWSPDVEE